MLTGGGGGGQPASRGWARRCNNGSLQGGKALPGFQREERLAGPGQRGGMGVGLGLPFERWLTGLGQDEGTQSAGWQGQQEQAPSCPGPPPTWLPRLPAVHIRPNVDVSSHKLSTTVHQLFLCAAPPASRPSATSGLTSARSGRGASAGCASTSSPQPPTTAAVSRQPKACTSALLGFLLSCFGWLLPACLTGPGRRPCLWHMPDGTSCKLPCSQVRAARLVAQNTPSRCCPCRCRDQWLPRGVPA